MAAIRKNETFKAFMTSITDDDEDDEDEEGVAKEIHPVLVYNATNVITSEEVSKLF